MKTLLLYRLMFDLIVNIAAQVETVLVSVTATVTATGTAQDGSTNVFISPGPAQGIPPDFSENPQWPLGSIQEISWKLDEVAFYAFTVSLWRHHHGVGHVHEGPIYCKEPFYCARHLLACSNNASARNPGDDYESRFSWRVTHHSFGLDVSNVFFFWLARDGPEGEYAITSHAFNTTTDGSDSAAQTTSSSKIPSSTDSVFSASSALPPSLTTTRQRPTIASNVSSHKEAKTLALGIGLGLGLPLLIIAGIIFGFSIFNTDGKVKLR
jgi:hypothetical protein